MTDDRWYRNETWDADIASAFEGKLRRARSKGQYLRIQASYLAEAHPRVALEFLDRYFALGEAFDQAQAHVDRATAWLALGRAEDAFTSFEAALDRERVFPNLLTGAYLQLPYQIALAGAAHRYDQAVALLSTAEDRLMFAVDHFMFHAAKAIIIAARDNVPDARAEATMALEAAGREHSGFRYHPGVGLVSDRHAEALAVLRTLSVPTHS